MPQPGGPTGGAPAITIEAVMTRDVITVSPTTPIHHAARLMVERGVSGLPVVDDGGRLVGIISDGDLILRQRHREQRPWWRSFFEHGEQLARAYQKAVGTTVGEVMTRSVISINPAWDIEMAATILQNRRIRRLPVVRDGQLVGIVSRGDLIKALATSPSPSVSRSDADLVIAMKARISREPWTSTFSVVVNAKDGVISLWGPVRSETEKSALETMARSIDGCRAVDNRLAVRGEAPYSYG